MKRKYSSLTLDARLRRSKAIHIPSELRDDFFRITEKWRKSSGDEWTITRMKDFKSELLALYNGKPRPTISWFAKTASGNLRGFWGRLVKYATQSPKTLGEVVKLLQVYTAFVSDRLTVKQEQKFLKAVMTDKPFMVPQQYYDYLRVAASKVRPHEFGLPTSCLTSRIRKDSHEDRLIQEWMTYSRSPRGLKMVTSDWFAKLYPAFVDLMGFRSRFSEDSTIGTIGITLESGYKARFYAAPHIWLQHATEGLKDSLLDLCKRVPWDGTHDQRLADPWICDAQKVGKQVHCFDLSNATDQFPRSLQWVLLDTWFPGNPVVELYKWVCEDSWKYNGKEVTWTRGQPLGTNPSFPLFALAHGLVIWALNNYRHDNKFFIVGDDVVILDDALAESYASMLDDLQLEWSPTKTLVGSRVAEFTGVLYIHGKMYKCPKWKPLRRDNLLDIVRLFGPAMIDTLKVSIREKVRFISQLPEPLGFGWNPKGLSLADRMNGLEELFLKEETPREYLTDLWTLVIDRFNSLSETDALTFSPAITNSNTLARINQEAKAYSEKVRENFSSLPIEILAGKIKVEPSVLTNEGLYTLRTKKVYSDLMISRFDTLSTKIADLCKEVNAESELANLFGDSI